MFIYRCDLDAHPVWGPLERVAELCCSSATVPPICPADFMYMARMVAPRRPDLHLYKHIDTRRYLNLDDAGHAYAFAGVLRGSGWNDDESLYVPFTDLREAIGRLRLSSRPAGAAAHRARWSSPGR